MDSSSTPLQGAERIDGLLFAHEHASDDLLNTMSNNGVTEELINVVDSMRMLSPVLSEEVQGTFRRLRDRLTRWPMYGGDTTTTNLVAALTHILFNNHRVGPPSATNAVPTPVDKPAQGTARAARILREVLAKCIAPNPVDLNEDDLSCSICQQAFLTTTEPETPLRLPCGHMCGSNCIMKWLNPLSLDAHNTCPMCRKPILNTPGPIVSAERLREIRELREWEARGDANGMSAWAIRAEQLYHDLCEGLVTALEDVQSDIDVWLSTADMSAEVIDFVTVQHFGDVLLNGPSLSYMDVISQNFEEFEVLMDHLKTGGSDDDDDFLSPGEATYARMSEWHRRIRLSRDTLLARIETTEGLR